MVTMLAIQELKLEADKVNIYGGACAQGHPIGSTGSRLVVTLAHAMQRLGKKKGIAALCIGGGEATAVALGRAWSAGQEAKGKGNKSDQECQGERERKQERKQGKLRGGRGRLAFPLANPPASVLNFIQAQH